MLNRMHERLGTAGFIVSVIALVFALAGGAYAAKSGLSSKQKKEVKSIATSVAKGLQGTGPQGPKGDPGVAGSAGKDGTNGTNGKDGTSGTNGKSIKLTPVAPGAAECGELGGALLKEEGGSAPAVEVCTGKEGSPWTAGGTLPPEATETGMWGFTGGTQTITTEVGGVEEEITIGDTEGVRAPISFALPLKEVLGESNVHFQTEPNFTDFDELGPGGSEVGCKGTNQAPKAPPGHLCVYRGSLVGATFLETKTPGGGTKGAGVPGAVMNFEMTGGPARGFGSFAVTAPPTPPTP